MKYTSPWLAALALACAGLPAASQTPAAVPGYAYGQKSLANAPHTLADLASLKKALLFTEDDERALRQSKATLADRTDGANSATQINFRYIPALTIPITTTLKPFLAKKGASASGVEKMHAAWVKAVMLQSILWSQPYIRDGEF